MVKKIILWALVIGWMVLIFSFSSQTALDSTDLSSTMLGKILAFFGITVPDEKLSLWDYIFRKAAHFGIYAILGLLLCVLMRSGYEMRGRVTVLVPFTVSVLYAFTDEFHQLFVSGRSGQLTDVAIDSAGALAGVVAAILLYLLAERRGTHD